MTTLSKEDVVRMADKIYWPYGSPVTYDGLQAFAELARSDLVAENERLKFALADTEALELGTAETLTAARTALAAAEARETKLRDLLSTSLSHAARYPAADKFSIEASQFLYQPRDDSALREMIAGVYEECAKGCRKEAVVIVVDGPEERAYNNAISDCELAIRALAEKAKA